MVPPSFFIFPRTARKEYPRKKQKTTPAPAPAITPEEDFLRYRIHERVERSFSRRVIWFSCR